MLNKLKSYLNTLRGKFAKKKGDEEISAESLNQNNDYQEKTGDIQVDPNQLSEDSQTLYPLESLSLKAKLLNIPLQSLKKVVSPVAKHFGQKSGTEETSFSGSHALQKINLNYLNDKIFDPQNRSKIHQVFVSGLILTLCYTTGKGIALFLNRKVDNYHAIPHTLSLPREQYIDYSPIKVANIFNAYDLQEIKKSRSLENVPCTLAEASSQSNLPIKLLNTVVLQDSVKSIAAVQIRGKQALTEIREGERIENIAKIDRIERLKIIFRNLDSNQCEYVSNSSDGATGRNFLQVMSPAEAKSYSKSFKHPDIQSDGNRFTIKKNFINEKLKDIGTILTQAKAVPITNPDGSLAFKVVEVDPGGPFAMLNIQVDDTITSINGKKITNLNEVMDLFGRIKDLDKLSINVLREGEEQTLDYNFTN